MTIEYLRHRSTKEGFVKKQARRRIGRICVALFLLVACLVVFCACACGGVSFRELSGIRTAADVTSVITHGNAWVSFQEKLPEERYNDVLDVVDLQYQTTEPRSEESLNLSFRVYIQGANREYRFYLLTNGKLYLEAPDEVCFLSTTAISLPSWLLNI